MAPINIHIVNRFRRILDIPTKTNVFITRNSGVDTAIMCHIATQCNLSA